VTVNLQDLISFVCIYSGNVIPLLIYCHSGLKLIARSDREIVFGKIVVEIGVFDWCGDVNTVPLEFPFAIAAFHNCLNNVEIAIFFDDSRLGLRVLLLVPNCVLFAAQNKCRWLIEVGCDSKACDKII
jgi:hypothetical protein